MGSRSGSRSASVSASWSALIAQLYEQKGSAYWLINGVNAVIALSLVSVIVSVLD